MPKIHVFNGSLAVSLTVGAACCFPAFAAPTVTSIVNTFGNDAVQSGLAPGLEIAVVIGTAKPMFFGYGVADAVTKAKPTKNTLFQVASVTKVFTTNLLGQAVHAKTLALSDRLSDFAAQLGTLPANTADVTLENLADFTGGFPSLAAYCTAGQKSSKTGCLPSGNDRPTIAEYSGQDIAAFFRTYTIAGAPPQPYFYSDFSLGLLGLLLGSEPGTGLSNKALTGWDTLLKAQLIKPLYLTSTFLNVPAKLTARLAPGYQTAQAAATVNGGGISALSLLDKGAGYTAAPEVTISGGGGSGAQINAEIGNGSVTGFTIANAGSGYIAPPSVTFSSGAAAATAIIKNGHIIGVSVRNGGVYTMAPTVTFSGGRVGGHDAKGTVFVDHDVVSYVQITDPGVGYVAPLAVSIAPGAPTTLPVPVWAPAGALKSSATDLATFAASALGHATVNGKPVPPAITAAFRLAETPYACKGASPGLSGCTAPKSGLAWDIFTSTPETISKDGGLPGYSSLVALLPNSDTAVVVLANNYTSQGEAPAIGAEIVAALFHSGLLPGAQQPR